MDRKFQDQLHFAIQDLDGTSSTVKIKPDPTYFSRAQKRLEPYKALPFLFRPVLEKVADYVRITMIPNTFRYEGPGWKPLARRTIAERIQAGFQGQHPILRRSGDLFRELTQRSHPKHIEIIKTGKMSRIEIGGSSEKFIQNHLGKGEAGQRLPSRPMIPGTGNIPLQDRDRIAIKSIVDTALRQRLARR